MRSAPNKILAIVMIFITVIGLLLSTFFLVQVWRMRKPVTEKLASVADQTSLVLQTTELGLNIIDQVVQNVYTSTVFLDDSAQTLVDTVDNTTLFIDSASTFMGDSLINTITNTQTALDSAQASAEVIDNILTTLSKVPLIGINYNPTKPLNVTLGEVSESLDPLQGSLNSFQSSLDATQLNMADIKKQLLVLEQNVVAINKNLKATQVVIASYKTQLKSLQSWLDNARVSLPGWIKTAFWTVTLFIVWLILIQVAILLQAISMMSVSRHELDTAGEEQSNHSD